MLSLMVRAIIIACYVSVIALAAGAFLLDDLAVIAGWL